MTFIYPKLLNDCLQIEGYKHMRDKHITVVSGADNVETILTPWSNFFNISTFCELVNIFCLSFSPLAPPLCLLGHDLLGVFATPLLSSPDAFLTRIRPWSLYCLEISINTFFYTFPTTLTMWRLVWFWQRNWRCSITKNGQKKFYFEEHSKPMNSKDWQRQGCLPFTSCLTIPKIPSLTKLLANSWSLFSTFSKFLVSLIATLTILRMPN